MSKRSRIDYATNKRDDIYRLVNPFPPFLSEILLDIPLPIIEIMCAYIDGTFFGLNGNIVQPKPIEIPLPQGPYSFDIVNASVIVTSPSHSTTFDLARPTIRDGTLIPNHPVAPCTTRKRIRGKNRENRADWQFVDELHPKTDTLSSNVYSMHVWCWVKKGPPSLMVQNKNKEHATLLDFINEHCVVQMSQMNQHIIHTVENGFIVNHVPFLFGTNDNGQTVVQWCNQIRLFQGIMGNVPFHVIQAVYIPPLRTFVLLVKDAVMGSHLLHCFKMGSRLELTLPFIFGFQLANNSRYVIFLSQELGLCVLDLKSFSYDFIWKPRYCPSFMQFLPSNRFFNVSPHGKWEICQMEFNWKTNRHKISVWASGETSNKGWTHVGVTNDLRPVFLNESKQTMTIWS